MTGDPMRFRERWLRYDPNRPTQTRIAKRFIWTVIGLLVACGISALIAM